jgi:hypothetical protein
MKTLTINLSRLGRVQDAVSGLAKRAKRLGLEAPAITIISEPRTEEGREVIDVRVTGVPSVTFGGWTFLGRIAHMRDETTGAPLNMITGTGATADDDATLAGYRAAAPDCGHCGTRRLRASTFVLRHTDGSVKQVGSTCLTDFLPSVGRNVEDVVFLASELERILIGDGEGGEGGGPGGSRYISLRKYLLWVAADIRQHGWISRKDADLKACGATADLAWNAMLSSKTKAEHRPEARDRWTAYRALVWARRLPESEQAQSSYLNNLHVVARAGLLDHRTMGIAASMVSAHQRALGRACERKGLEDGLNPDAVTGTPKARITLRARLIAPVRAVDSAYGVSMQHRFMDLQTGAELVWWASEGAADKVPDDVRPGWEGEITATVKAHGSFRGRRQTTILRVSF